ncbi:aspartate aminotransferase family protein [Ferrimonas marina]|uniref:Putrescine aminotransferase n=1 Tax=Ferrimonas marina TaxID=299255 RepID=A0A1M5ZIA9_9GAMM|nr:aspartate aminotransferase family protein [Ferrimonas marina]SHI23898.1 putrescine aminotransferase [Ferrimonas marina]
MTGLTEQTQSWQQLDAAHHLHPFTDNQALGQKGSRVVTHAEGVYVYDSEGHKTLDGMAGLWCVNMGYGQQAVIDAITEQLKVLPYYNLFFQSTHPTAAELSALLAQVLPAHMNRVFYTGSGSECNDTVIRMVRHYWASQGKPDKTVMISRHNAYHGSTMAGASLGGMKPMHQQGGLPIPDICHIDQPYHFEEGGNQDPETFGLERARQLEQKILELGEDRVAAFIAEPIQGAGGVIIAPDSYWKEIKRICDQYHILFISDEVICGFGRTGHWFGCQYYGIEPDLISMAKGITSGYLPLGAVAVSDRVAQGLLSQGGEFNHGFTYSGHPAACAAAIANIKLMQEQDIVTRVRDEIGPYLQQQWATLADHPIVGETRGIGMVAALELVENKVPRTRFHKDKEAGMVCREHCIANGLIMRAVGDTMIIAPPLIITRTEVDQLVATARKSLDDTWRSLQR